MGRPSHRRLRDPIFHRIDMTIGAPLRQRLDDAADRARSAELRLDALEHGQREQLAYLSQRLDALEARFGSERALFRGALAGAMDSVGPITTQLDSLGHRLEFVRAELFAEINRAFISAAPRQSPKDHGPPPKNVTWRPPPGPIRLNLGCGPIAVDGYINVDARDLPTADLVADVCALPVEDASVDEVRAAHLLEHFTESQIREVLLPEWLRVLRPTGRIVIIAPDSDAMVRAYAEGAMTFEDLKLVTFGGGEYDGNVHFTMFTPASVVSLLEGSGFCEVTVVASARPNGACLEFEVRAQAPGDSQLSQ